MGHTDLPKIPGSSWNWCQFTCFRLEDCPICTQHLRSSVREVFGFLVTSLSIRAPAQTASAGKSPACSRLPPFQSDGDHSALGNLQFSRTLFGIFSRSLPGYKPVSELWSQFFRHQVWFLLWYCQLRPHLCGLSWQKSSPVSRFYHRWRLKM